MRWQAAARASCPSQLFLRAGRQGRRDSETFGKAGTDGGRTDKTDRDKEGGKGWWD